MKEEVTHLNMGYVSEVMNPTPYLPMLDVHEFMTMDKISIEQDEVWVKNYTANRDMINPTFYLPIGRNKICVLVGASPAVKKNYEVLHQLDDNFLIITSPTMLKFLLEKEIYPDVVMAIEGRDHWLSDFECDTRDLYMVASPFLPPEALDMWQGCYNHYCLRGGHLYDEMIQEDYPHIWDVGGGNVLSTAFLWAFKYWHCRRFIFIGMSFCFYDDYYFDKRKYPMAELEEEVLPKALDINGNIATTTGAFISYKLWLESAMRSAVKLHNAEFVNATEDGILGVWPEVDEVRDGVYYGRKKFCDWINIIPFQMAVDGYKEMFRQGGL